MSVAEKEPSNSKNLSIESSGEVNVSKQPFASRSSPLMYYRCLCFLAMYRSAALKNSLREILGEKILRKLRK